MIWIIVQEFQIKSLSKNLISFPAPFLNLGSSYTNVVSFSFEKSTSARAKLAVNKSTAVFRDRSLFITWRWGRGEDFSGITWFLGEQKGGQPLLRTQKGESLKTLEGFRGGTTQVCLENEDVVGGRESHQTFLGGGGALQWSNIQRGDLLNFTSV